MPEIITLQDLDQYIGWTLVAVGAPKSGATMRFRSAQGAVVDIGLSSTAAVTLSEAAVPTSKRAVRDCPKSPTGQHSWRPSYTEVTPGQVRIDPTRPETCILCGQSPEPEA